MRYLIFTVMLFATPSLVAGQWKMLPGSSFTYEASFEGAAIPGWFRQFAVNLEFDQASPETGSLRVTVDLRAADMGDPELNDGIADPDWFHLGKFPEAVYSTDDITAIAPGEYLAKGVLRLKGVSKPVVLPFSWSESGTKAQMRGEFVMKRTDFDVGSGEWANGDSIGIDIGLKFDIRLEHYE